MAKGSKTGGRTKGTPNKSTKELRESLKSILQQEIEQIPELLSQIEDPEKRLMLTVRLMPYVMPVAREEEVVKSTTITNRFFPSAEEKIRQLNIPNPFD
jgi:hypothetical protein